MQCQQFLASRMWSPACYQPPSVTGRKPVLQILLLFWFGFLFVCLLTLFIDWQNFSWYFYSVVEDINGSVIWTMEHWRKKNHLYVKTNSLLVKQVTKTQALARAVELKMSLRGLCFIWEAILSLQRLVRAITIRSTLSLDGNWVLSLSSPFLTTPQETTCGIVSPWACKCFKSRLCDQLLPSFLWCPLFAFNGCATSHQLTGRPVCGYQNTQLLYYSQADERETFNQHGDVSAWMAWCGRSHEARKKEKLSVGAGQLIGVWAGPSPRAHWQGKFSSSQRPQYL